MATLASACWVSKPNQNLEGKWNGGIGVPLTGAQMCKWRFATLSEAMAACEQEPLCDGVTKDGGFDCPVEGAEALASGNASSTLTPTFKFRYHCRSAPTRPWAGIHSWVRTKGACASTRVLDDAAVPPQCPTRTAARAAAEPARGSAELGRRARRIAHLERRSAVEAQALDEAEVQQGRCPSNAELGRAAEELRAPSCPAVLPVLAELALLPPRGLDEVCRSDCTVTHATLAFKDGWGAQQFRRASLFFAGECLPSLHADDGPHCMLMTALLAC